jgi:site-specific recombinase XerD
MNFLTPDELRSVLKLARAKSTRDWLMILVTYTHGLRRAEVCDLLVSDVKDGHLTVRRKKGSRTTVQPLLAHRGEPLLDELRGMKEWLRERSKDSGDVLFPSACGKMHPFTFNRLFKGYALAAGLPASKAHAHALKHAIATTLVRSGLDIAHVQTHLGHASISSTQKYVHLNQDEVSDRVANSLMTAF